MHKILDTPSASHNPMCYQGMVTSPHYLASAAGLDILRRGGNALESAIAMATTLAVVYPHMCSLGADGFFLVYTANDQKLRALNGSGRAAKKASLKYFEDLGYKSIPERGPLAANTVPGLILALEKIHKLSTESLGGRFAWAELLKDATTYAEEGCPCATSLAQVAAKIASFLKKQAQDFSFAAEFQRCLYPLGQPLKIGERLRQVDLANSLKTLASEGAESFYQGSLCEKIFRDPVIQEGLLSKEDFASAQAAWVEPLTIPYGPYLACNTPPNSQGLASLEILNILQEADLASLGLSAKYYHLVVEATKAAFFDRDQYLSDPDFVKIPIDELLSKEHAKKQFQKINKQASCFPTPLAAHGDTVWFGVCDNYGNAVSAIQSIFYEFGSLVIPKGTGIIFQNRGCYFSLDPNKPNVLAPKKRTLHT
ncbi:MAG: gamma-glutamyltransferase family protein, partial [Desulfovibrio sp.]|nr:gamma-glutamyltransferase family protein [Desulfovibrio sp.]